MRKDGFYWVRLKNDSEWTIGKFTGRYEDTGDVNQNPWEIVACDDILKETDFQEIGNVILNDQNKFINKINVGLNRALIRQKKDGKEFISDKEIDELIDKIIEEEEN